MREELQQLGSDDRHRFYGVFVRRGSKTGGGRTVLMQDVRDAEGNIVADHIWFNLTKGFEQADPHPGDVLAFDARVAEYKKGYHGTNERKAARLNREATFDYKLSRPTRITKTGIRQKVREAKSRRQEEFEAKRQKQARRKRTGGTGGRKPRR